MSSSSSRPDLSSLKIDDHARHRGGLGKILAFISAGGGLVLIVAGLVFALRTHKPVVEVIAARKAQAGEATTLLNASGYVTPRRRATIAAKITARVTAVYAEEGLHVHEGEILARLDDSDALVRLASARANREAAQAAIQDLQVQLSLAERELHRAEELQKEGIDSVEVLDTSREAADSLRAKIALAKEQVNAAQAMIAVAQQDVDNCTVRAPFTGEVVSKDAQVGEMVSPVSAGGGFTRTGIATIVDMNSNEIEVDVNESFIARVKDGQPVVATLDAYPDWKIPAKVRTVIPTADRQKATVKVRISFDHLDPRILPDMGVKVAFLDTSEQPSGKSKSANAAPQTLIPQDAVIQDGGKPVVFVLHDTKVERRAVSLGGDHGTDVEVFAGITSGESVVVKPPEGLHDGEEVEIKR